MDPDHGDDGSDAMVRHWLRDLSPRGSRPRLTLLQTVRQVVASWLLGGLVAGAAALGVQYVHGGTALGQVLIVDDGGSHPARTQGDAAYVAKYDRLTRWLDCRRDGFGPDVIPGSALINLDGTVRAVTFDRGWASYEGRRPGTLAAVCRVPLPR